MKVKLRNNRRKNIVIKFGPLHLGIDSLPKSYPQDMLVTSETPIFIADDCDKAAIVVKTKKGLSLNVTGFSISQLKNNSWRYKILRLLYPHYFK